ncbi:MAG: YtxH domain-containing protein [Flavobacteriaceae bacterium]|nr:YtxH domain-containing protein [Flavobacteriaceae bacterium]
MSDNTGNTLIALLTGAAVGATLGLLYAPQSGEKTRKQIKKEAKNAQKSLEKKYDEASEKLSEYANEAKSKFEEKLNSTIDQAKGKSDSLLATMESELENLKKKNADLMKELKSVKK